MITTVEEFKKALIEAGFKIFNNGYAGELFWKDGIRVRKERDISGYRVFRKTSRGGYQKIHHERSLDCTYNCAITCEPKEKLTPDKIKPLPFIGNTTIHVARGEEFTTYCIKHQVNYVRVQPAAFNKETGIVSVNIGDIAKPDTKIWWLARCITPKGAKFQILTDEKVFYCVEYMHLDNWKITDHVSTKNMIKLDEMSKTDIYLISFVIAEYKKEVAGEDNE